MNRIAVVSAKGGVGKTTVSLNLALAYAESAYPTLLVDLDPQGSIGHSLRRADTDWPGLVEVLAGEATVEEVLVRTREPNLALLPRGRLDPVDAVLFEDHLRQPGALDALLAPLGDRYVRTLFDTPAGVGVLGRAALEASDFALVVVKAEPLALRTIEQTLRVVEHVRDTSRASLTLLGVLPTMVELDKDHSNAPLLDLWSNLHAVLEANIPRSDTIAQCSLLGSPIGYLTDPPPPEAHRFAQLVAELEQRALSHAPRKADHETSPARSLL